MNFICTAVCGTLANRPHTDLLAKKDECNVGIHDSQEQVHLFRSSEIGCNSDRTVKHKPYINDAPVNQKSSMSYLDAAGILKINVETPVYTERQQLLTT